MRLLGISGSLRRESYNSALLRAAADLLPPGSELAIFEGLRDVPPYDEDIDREPAPAGVRELRASIAQADGLLIATPEYNSSIPGQLKNAVDWASRPAGAGALRGKDATVIGASTSMFGAVWAQAELRRSLAAAGARVLDRELPVARAAEAFTPSGQLADGELESELREILAALEAEVNRSMAIAA